MKIFTRINKTYFYSLLTLILMVATVFALPNTIAFSAAGDPSSLPTINISSPSPDAKLMDPKVVISGTYVVDVNVLDSNKLIFTASDSAAVKNPISDSSIDNGDWDISPIGTDGKGTWTFTKTLSEGTHGLSIELKDTLNDQLNHVVLNFSIDSTRPYISSMKIVLPIGEVNAEDLTNVAENASIKMKIIDNNPITNLESQINSSPKPFKIKLGSDDVVGDFSVQNDEVASQPGSYVYDITFNPSKEKLFKLNTTYMVYVDSSITDDSKNPIYAKSLKFTTKSDMDSEDNPHGHYGLNTNMCAACHSTHDSKNSPSLIGGSYQITFSEKLSKDQPADDPSQNYCMACHDGTTNAPFDMGDNGFHHNNPVEDTASDKEALKQPESCTSCHNPHLERTDDNPNMLKDHYVYTHDTADLNEKGLTTRVVDSLDTSCDTCHEDYTVNGKSIYTYPAGEHIVLSYSKATTAVGNPTSKIIDENIGKNPDETIKTIADYSLCLRCHNVEKNKNIEQYYTKDSGHNFKMAAGKTTNADGSTLNGPIPCAECHDTHGSNNLYNLRDVLGNSAPLSEEDKYSTTGTVWSEGNERTFCLKCHNQGTEIYGKKATFKDIPEHQGDAPVCSSCHGGSFIEAAHAPTKITTTP